MKIYIASPHIRSQTVNKEIYEKLVHEGFEVFLPKDINMDDHTDIAGKMEIATICYNEIDICDTIIIVCPFGVSVACEIGYAIYQKRKFNNKKLILFNNNIADEKLCSETMFIPYVDNQVSTIEELINIISRV